MTLTALIKYSLIVWSLCHLCFNMQKMYLWATCWATHHLLFLSCLVCRQSCWLRTSGTGREEVGLRSASWREEMSGAPQSWWKPWRRCSGREMAHWRRPPQMTNTTRCRITTFDSTSKGPFLDLPHHYHKMLVIFWSFNKNLHRSSSVCLKMAAIWWFRKWPRSH